MLINLLKNLKIKYQKTLNKKTQLYMKKMDNKTNLLDATSSYFY